MSNGGQDISIEVAAAQAWKREVDVEVAAVKRLLNDVALECQEIAGSDDSIMQAIESAGKVLEDAWGKLIGGFEQIGAKIDEVFKKYHESGNAMVDLIEDFKGKIGL